MPILPDGSYGEIKHNQRHSKICKKDPLIEAKSRFLFDLKDALTRQFWNLREVYDTIAAL